MNKKYVKPASELLVLQTANAILDASPASVAYNSSLQEGVTNMGSNRRAWDSSNWANFEDEEEE